MADPTVSTACSLLALAVALLLLLPLAQLSSAPLFLGLFDRKRRFRLCLVGNVAVNTVATILLAWMQLAVADAVHTQTPEWMNSDNSALMITVIILLSPFSYGSIKPPTTDIEYQLKRMRLLRPRHYFVADGKNILDHIEGGSVPDELDNDVFEVIIRAKQMTEWDSVFASNIQWAMYLPCASALTIMAFDPTSSTMRHVSLIAFLTTFIVAMLVMYRFAVGRNIWRSAQMLVNERSPLSFVSISR